MKYSKPLKAFSLIELAVVVLIIGLVTIVAVNGKSLLVKANCVASSFGTKNVTNNLDNSAELTSNPNSKYETCVNNALGIATVVTPTGLCSGSPCTSCKTLLAANSGIASGTYTIDPDGAGTGLSPFTAYCDMTTDGGGWTLVVAQYEDSPVTNWNQGITTASFTAPTSGMLDNCGNSTAATNSCNQTASNGFALNSSQIPTHTQTAFGRGSNSTFIGYSNFVYNTGNIAKTQLLNLKDNNNYHVYRGAGAYINLDPEGSFAASGGGWAYSLTYDKIGSSNSWAFAPLVSGASCGFAMNESSLGTTYENYAWTVWVR